MVRTIQSTRGRHAALAGLLCIVVSSSAFARGQQAQADQPPRFDTAITVTTNRTAETQIDTPSSIVQISGAALEARGVRTLAEALTLLPGIEVSQGGDEGPMPAPARRST